MADLFRKILNNSIACTKHHGPHCKHCNKTKGRSRSIVKNIKSSARRMLRDDVKNQIMEMDEYNESL